MGILTSTEPRASKFYADLDCCIVVQELGAQVPAEAITSTVKDLLFKKHTSNAAMSCAAGEDGA